MRALLPSGMRRFVALDEGYVCPLQEANMLDFEYRREVLEYYDSRVFFIICKHNSDEKFKELLHQIQSRMRKVNRKTVDDIRPCTDDPRLDRPLQCLHSINNPPTHLLFIGK